MTQAREALCAACPEPVRQRRSPSGGLLPGRPRRYCDECRLRRPRSTPALPRPRRAEAAVFAASVRAAIARKGCSLRELETMLARYGGLASSTATLSGWQTGHNAPACTETGRDRVLALERCLDVPAGDLAILLPGGPVPRTTRPVTQIAAQRRAALDPLTVRHEAMQQIINRLTGLQQIIPVSTTKEYRLGWGRRPVMTIITPTVRAAHDHVDRYWFLHAPSTLLHPSVLGGPGCTRGRVLSEPVRRNTTEAQSPDEMLQLEAVELLFDQVLTRGEHYTFSFSVGYACESSAPLRAEQLFRHIQVQPCEKLDLSLTFERDWIPMEVTECQWRARDFHQTRQTPLEWEPDGRFRQVITNPLPGCYGWRWEWPTAASIVHRTRRGSSPACTSAA